MNWAYGFAVASRLPRDARRAFDEVLRLEPANSKALYGRAMLAVQEEETEDAIRHFDAALQSTPAFFEARRYRAILLARTGKLEQAIADINWCLDKETRSGASFYAAACVTSLAAKQLSDTRLRDQALELLEKAFAFGVKPAKAKLDPDLAEIREHPKFREVFAKAMDGAVQPSMFFPSDD